MDSETPSCLTLRRNPHRKAKAKATPAPIRPFPLQDILQCDVQQQDDLNPSSQKEIHNHDNLRLYLRIRPQPKPNAANNISINRSNKPINNNKPKDEQVCLFPSTSQSSVTLTPPLQAMQDSKRARTEVYDGFTRVFAPEASQTEVYEAVMGPLVSDFINGNTGMLLAMGPSGSGKTHTIFGCPRQPGLLPRTIQQIFNCTNQDRPSQTSRSFYISMFEIYSQGGKGEKIFDLSSDAAHLSFQQSTVKGLQEVRVFDAKDAEALIACGMMRRTTATTNSNSQSSRSQCIINIRGSREVIDSEVEAQLGDAILTIVDLAGAEREKKTGNQGMRLLESNFINNTSLVFGSCLRALLEHQKNPKKPLQKHFQNSLLTRYLRDYLEGKKRMTLILTVKPGSYDYPDTSFLLRQASPFMKIKYNNYAGEPNLKRHINTFPRVEHPKRRKFGDHDATVVDERKSASINHQIIGKELQQVDALKVSGSPQGPELVEINGSARLKECHDELAAFRRNEKVMQKFSRALWNVLKQYKEKLEETENEVRSLKISLEEKNAQCLELEKELNHERSCFSHHKHFSEPSSDLEGNKDAELAVQHSTNHEANDTSEMINVTVGESNFPNTDVKEERCKISKSFPKMELDSSILRDLTNEVSLDNSTDFITDHSQTESLLGHDNRPSMEQKTLSNEEALSCLPVPSKEEAEHTDAQNDSEREADHRLPCRYDNAVTVKPRRRRLLPASALLLSEMNSLNLEDENDKAKGNRGGRKLAPGKLGQTRGSISLLRMLNGVRL
ncbi:hypothetical protein Syun_015814 [Stephania yunnanensis]|uniref:Kinesin motor domain-containing protein n=1 Tax=Stephania yunnanensis TaxID=152371 RepID=A0AAP0JM95_9MAGN